MRTRTPTPQSYTQTHYTGAELLKERELQASIAMLSPEQQVRGGKAEGEEVAVVVVVGRARGG